jgi:hypothetical protein
MTPNSPIGRSSRALYSTVRWAMCDGRWAMGDGRWAALPCGRYAADLSTNEHRKSPSPRLIRTTARENARKRGGRSVRYGRGKRFRGDGPAIKTIPRRARLGSNFLGRSSAVVDIGARKMPSIRPRLKVRECRCSTGSCWSSGSCWSCSSCGRCFRTSSIRRQAARSAIGSAGDSSRCCADRRASCRWPGHSWSCW